MYAKMPHRDEHGCDDGHNGWLPGKGNNAGHICMCPVLMLGSVMVVLVGSAVHGANNLILELNAVSNTLTQIR